MLKKILKDSFYLVISQGITKAITFFYVLFLAKNLGVENFGLYSVALSYLALFLILADFGSSRFLVREIARLKVKILTLVSHTLLIRLTIISVCLSLVSLLLYNLDPIKLRVFLILITLFAAFPYAVSLTFENALAGLEKFKFLAFFISLINLLTALIGLILILNGYGVFGAVYAILISQIIYASILGVCCFKFNIKLIFPSDNKLIKEILVQSLPYGLIGVLALIYFRIDTLILSYLKGNYDAGIYAAGYKFLEAIVFIPTALSTAIFPSLVKLHQQDKNAIKKMFKKIILISGGFGCLIMVGYWLILPSVILYALPQYTKSIEVISILSLTIPLMFILSPISQIVLSDSGLVKTQLLVSLFLVGFNIIFNLIFVPRYGYFASAWITVLSDLLSLVLMFFIINKFVFKKNLKTDYDQKNS